MTSSSFWIRVPKTRLSEGVSILHGARRRLDGLSFRRLCADTVGVSSQLELVSRHVSRLRAIRQQYLAADVGHSPCRGSHASGDVPSARDLQLLPQRVVPMGKGSPPES